MRKLLEQINERLQAFLDQRDSVALVVSSPDADALPILKTVEGLEATNPSDLFWTFTDAFTEVTSYAQSVVDSFATVHGAMQLAMPREDMTPWPDIPSPILDETTPPAQRLRALAAFSRELLPVPLGGNCIWTLYPLQIADPSAYAAMIRQLLHHEMPFPWCHHLRFIVRDDPTMPIVQTVLAGAPRIDSYSPDLSAEAVYRSVEAECADENRSLEERLSGVLVLAGTDAAFGRHAQAIEKYELLLQYHAPRGNHAMAAAALNGMGESFEKLHDLERAGECYQAALIPASHGEHAPIIVFLNVVLNLANLRFMEQRWADAEAYYDAAQQLATVARDGATKARALEYRGTCQRWQGRFEDAEQSWIGSSVIAAQLQDVALCRSSIERLRQHYAETGRYREERERREQLAALTLPGGT